MMQKEIRVGIVGANANKSWAKMSHVPAINGLPGLKLAAVATSRVLGKRLKPLLLIAGSPIPSR